jgi:hypothetical protein
MNFSSPVNNITIFLTATGMVNNENFVFTTNTGTGIPTISSTSSCFTTIIGNQILSGAGAPITGGGGKFLIQNSVNFTSLTITGSGVSSGSLLSICTDSFPVNSVSFVLFATYSPGSVSAFYDLYMDQPLEKDIILILRNYIYLTSGDPIQIDTSISIFAGETNGSITQITDTDYSLLNGESVFDEFSIIYDGEMSFSVDTSYVFNPPIITPTPTVTLTSTPTHTPTPTPTPTVTETPSETPIPTLTPTNTITSTETVTPTLTSTITETPTNTPTLTPTITESPTNTPTPSVTPQPVTGYSFNLVALPYTFPSSGNTIMNEPILNLSGGTDPNLLATGGIGLYWNKIDSNGVDRTDYFSAFTGQSITITMSQSDSTVIYSGDTNSLKYWVASLTDSGFVFGAGIGTPDEPSSGTAVIIQSSSTEWIIGLPVYISVVNNVDVTPTPTPTVTPTITPTETPTNTP